MPRGQVNWSRSPRELGFSIILSAYNLCGQNQISKDRRSKVRSESGHDGRTATRPEVTRSTGAAVRQRCVRRGEGLGLGLGEGLEVGHWGLYWGSSGHPKRAQTRPSHFCHAFAIDEPPTARCSDVVHFDHIAKCGSCMGKNIQIADISRAPRKGPDLLRSKKDPILKKPKRWIEERRCEPPPRTV